MRVSRREFLTAAGATAVAAGLGSEFLRNVGGASSTGRLLASALPRPQLFEAAFRNPPVLRPSSRTPDGDHYVITQHVGRARILNDVDTEIWGYNGVFPGPTLETRRGRPVTVTHTNLLPVPTSVHLHGGRTPADSDGYPTDLLYPANGGAQPAAGSSGTDPSGALFVGSRPYRYPLEQRAATLWYHDHRMDFTGPSVWRGLAGFHIVRDDNEDRLGLPSGDHELLVMIVDRSFGRDGNFIYPSLDPTLLHTPGVRPGFEAGVLGDVILVNGAPWPVAHVDAARYRLRILNACNARRLDLRLDPEPPSGFIQVGSDGGLLSRPVHQVHLEVAQAERFDVVVDFSSFRRGSRVTMVNGFGSGRTGLIMQFIVGARVDDTSRVPEHLSDEDVGPSGRVLRHRSFRFASAYMGAHRAWTINGRFFHPEVTLAEPAAGDLEVWHLVTDFHHPVHLHLNPFRVLSRGTGARGPFDAGWKDTIDLRPAELASILIPFDPAYRGRYPFHCHNLEHEDMAMMANFVVR